MSVVNAPPPWYYMFHFGSIWSLIIIAVIVVGFTVFFILRKTESKGKKILKWCGLGAAAACFAGWAYFWFYIIVIQ